MIWTLGTTPPGMDPKRTKRLKFPKGPADFIPVTLDFSGPLDVIEDDYLSAGQAPSATAFRNDGAVSDLLVVPPLSVNDTLTRITLWLAAGTAGFEYLVSVTAYTGKGQTLVRSFIIPVNLR